MASQEIRIVSEIKIKNQLINLCPNPCNGYLQLSRITEKDPGVFLITGGSYEDLLWLKFFLRCEIQFWSFYTPIFRREIDQNRQIRETDIGSLVELLRCSQIFSLQLDGLQIDCRDSNFFWDVKLNFGLFPEPISNWKPDCQICERIDLALGSPSSDIVSDYFSSRERELNAIHLSQPTCFSKMWTISSVWAWKTINF